MDHLTGCRDCHSPIPVDAARCRYCGARQTSWWETAGGMAAILVVVALVALLAASRLV